MDTMKFINIGYGNIIPANRIIAVVSPDSAPIKRVIQEAREESRIIDATYGRKTRAVVVMDSNHIVLSTIMPDTIGNRLSLNDIE